MMGNGNDSWRVGDGMGWGGWLMMTVFAIMCLAVLGGLLYVLLRGSRPGIAPGAVDHAAHPPDGTVRAAAREERPNQIPRDHS